MGRVGSFYLRLSKDQDNCDYGNCENNRYAVFVLHGYASLIKKLK